jgi:hypothetical protein
MYIYYAAGKKQREKYIIIVWNIRIPGRDKCIIFLSIPSVY